MVGTLLLAVIVGILAAIVGAFIALKLERTLFNEHSIEEQQKIWERAQEHSRSWETRQERRITELETRLTKLVEELQKTLQDREAQNKERIQTLAQQFEALERHTSIEQTLANLPRVEDRPLGMNGHIFPDWHPPMLHDADLSGRDLSYRYLRQADLRNTQLVKTNFFMADLTGAHLSGADLSGADLSCANLSGADLRDTILTGANLQVADLQGTILTDANLLDAHNLTTQQLYSAVYDSSTMLDDDVNVTARIPAVKVPKAAKTDQQAKPTPPEELAIPDLPTENMPAVLLSNEAEFVTEPEMHAASNGAAPIQPPETPFPLDETDGDEPAFLAALKTSFPKSEYEGDALQEPKIEDALTQPEIAVPASDITHTESPLSEATEPAANGSTLQAQTKSTFPSLLPDLDSLIQQQNHSLLLSQLSSGDSLLDPEVTDLLVDKPENSHTEGFDRATPRRKRSGKRKAKAS
jgi:gas vesicle protein